MSRPKLCLRPEHMSKHGKLEMCPVCGGRILRFNPGPDPGLDDLFAAPDEPPDLATKAITLLREAGFQLVPWQEQMMRAWFMREDQKGGSDARQ